jgi:hypothetical protein
MTNTCRIGGRAAATAPPADAKRNVPQTAKICNQQQVLDKTADNRFVVKRDSSAGALFVRRRASVPRAAAEHTFAI